MTTEQHFADDGDIKQLSLDETRSAAKQLLDSVEGDLTGDVAQRFQALTRHAEELRAEQRRRGREAEEALRRCRAGELRVVPGAPTGGDDGDAPPGNSLRDTAFRTLDVCVRDGLMSSRAAGNLVPHRAAAVDVVGAALAGGHRQPRLPGGVRQEGFEPCCGAHDLDRPGSGRVA